jgi:hypothetical protein
VAEREYFKSSGSINLPIDGTFLTDEFSPEYDGGMIIIALYDANNDIVTASAGTCVVSSSAIAGQFIGGVSYGDETIDLTEAGPVATYNIPGYNGPQIQARIVLASVVGAEYAQAYLWRY